MCAYIVLVACAAREGSTSLAGRATSINRHGPLPIGALINARGPMELISLNIGSELRILS